MLWHLRKPFQQHVWVTGGVKVHSTVLWHLAETLSAACWVTGIGGGQHGAAGPAESLSSMPGLPGLEAYSTLCGTSPLSSMPGIQGLEVYSTVLWHLRKEVDLAHLAQEAVALDRRSPYAWIALGNCFSLQKVRHLTVTGSEHLRAGSAVSLGLPSQL